MQGLHILADLHDCPSNVLLESAAQLRKFCLAACARAGLTVLGSHFHQFAALGTAGPGGVTGAVVLGESHLAIHTWPERAGATLDIYTCNVAADNSARAEALYAFLHDALAPRESTVERVWRGRGPAQ
ncbi:MAG: adenosylmethionine decarboxylase [Burkholderiales bacterium]|nr:adenosylmethionine decarboxylase [Burkholderiales bacterium]